MALIVAHRGAPKLAHENTIEAFLAAVSLGADMIELDVRKCGDGTLIIQHDPWLAAVGKNITVASLSYRELNERVAKKGFRVPTVEEAFRALAGKIRLDIELKEPGYEAEVVTCARRYFADTQFVMTSFNPQIIASLKKIDARLQTGLIMANAAGLAFAESSPAEVLAPGKRLYLANRGFFAQAKRRGKKIAVWTVDGADLISRLLADPVVDAIITNHPERALAQRNKTVGTRATRSMRKF